MKKKDLLNRIGDLAQPICRQYGVILWDITFEKEGSQYDLSIFIDKAEGVFLEDCEKISRAIDPLLDEAEFDSLPPYTLTVSSAGIQRRLRTDAHFAWAAGREIELTFYKKGCLLTGILMFFDGETLTLETDAGRQEIERSKISQARIHYRFT